MRGSRCGLSRPQSIPFDQPESFQPSPPGALGSVGVTSPLHQTTPPCPATLCYPPTKDRPQGRGSGGQYHASRAAPGNDVGLPYRSVGAIATNRQSGIVDVTCHFTHNPQTPWGVPRAPSQKRESFRAELRDAGDGVGIISPAIRFGDMSPCTTLLSHIRKPRKLIPHRSWRLKLWEYIHAQHKQGIQ
jgi:hypothetical protein